MIDWLIKHLYSLFCLNRVNVYAMYMIISLIRLTANRHLIKDLII